MCYHCFFIHSFTANVINIPMSSILVSIICIHNIKWYQTHLCLYSVCMFTLVSTVSSTWCFLTPKILNHSFIIHLSSLHSQFRLQPSHHKVVLGDHFHHIEQQMAPSPLLNDSRYFSYLVTVITGSLVPCFLFARILCWLTWM